MEALNSYVIILFRAHIPARLRKEVRGSSLSLEENKPILTA